MTRDADDPLPIPTDLTPADIEAAQYRVIHELHGHYYDPAIGAETPSPLASYTEPTMQQSTVGAAQNAANAANAASPRADPLPPLVAARHELARAEANVLMTILEEELTPSGLHYAAKLRTLVGLPARSNR